MRRSAVLAIAACFISLGAGKGLAQKDPLEGRWEGTVRSQQGERPATATFKKEGSNYSGTISGLQDNSEFPFRQVKVDGDKVNARVQMDGPRGAVVLNIRLNLKGETLKGKGDLNMGAQVVDLSYDLKRVSEAAQTPSQAAPGTPGQAQSGPPVSPAESEQFEKLRTETDPAAKKRLVEEFIPKYPQSGLLAFVHQEAAYLGQQTNNFEMMIEHGEKSLALFPANYLLMTQMAHAYAERSMTDKAEALAEKALDLVMTAEKPPQATEEQWAQGKKMILATNFSALGYVHLRRAQGIIDPAEKKKEVERAIAPFKKALENHANDDVSLWRLGTTYALLNDYANAEANLAKAVAVNGVAASYARTTLEEIYKAQHKGSLEGLDKVIAKAKSEVTTP